jgi:ribonuclease D
VTPEIVAGDLSDAQLARYTASGAVAVDTETLGLHHDRDRLCVVQLCDRELRGTVVQIPRFPVDGPPPAERAPRLRRLMEDPAVLKVFHFARFDVAALRLNLGIRVAPLYCTRTASKIARTYTDRHGLKDIALELLDVEIEKVTTHSDWGAATLSPAQVRYAISDVTMLLPLMDRLEVMLAREERLAIAQECMRVIPVIAELDLRGYDLLFEH